MIQGMKVCFFIVLLLQSLPAFSRVPNDTIGDEQKTIYFFSGIGADSSAFNNLVLPGYRKVHISWIPAEPHETIAHYAGRIKSQIRDKNPYIVGLSFGGIMAVEVAKQIEVSKMVLISSAKTRDDLNKFQCFFMRLGMFRLVPASLLRHTNFITYSYFGAKSSDDKKEVAHLLGGTDISFFRWALKNIASWDNEEAPARTIQIHGTSDRIIAYRLVDPDYSIKGGGHLMVFNKADTISKIILDYFND